MNVNLKKMWPAAAASLVFFTSLANAATGSATSNSMQNVPPKTNLSNPPKMDVNPAARPVVRDGVDLFVSGDFLWWKAVQDDLEYVATVTKGTSDCFDNDFLVPYKSTYYGPKFQYDPGFRVGIGYNIPYDGWDIFVNWTRFYTTAKDHRCAFPCEQISSTSGLLTASSCDPCCDTSCDPCCDTSCDPCCDTSCNTSCGTSCDPCCEQDCSCCCEPCCGCCDVCFDCGCPTSLIPTFSPYLTQDQFATTTVAYAKWKLKLNILDGEIGREFFVSKRLTIRPFMGVRGAWVHQSYNVKYETGLNRADPGLLGFSIGEINATLTSCVNMKNNFDGVGPRAGFNTNWMLGSGFSFYANTGISLLWGQFKVSTTSNNFMTGEAITLALSGSALDDVLMPINECSQLQFSDKFNSTKAVTDLALGLQWQGSFADDRVGLMIQIGWDQHIFFNQNQLVQLQQQANPNALLPVAQGSLVETIRSVLGQFIGLTLPSSLNTSQLQVSERRSGDLSAQGLTVSARLDF